MADRQTIITQDKGTSSSETLYNAEVGYMQTWEVERDGV